MDKNASFCVFDLLHTNEIMSRALLENVLQLVPQEFHRSVNSLDIEKFSPVIVLFLVVKNRLLLSFYHVIQLCFGYDVQLEDIQMIMRRN